MNKIEPSPYQQCLGLIKSGHLDKALEIAQNDIKITNLADKCFKMIAEAHYRNEDFQKTYLAIKLVKKHSNRNKLLDGFFRHLTAENKVNNKSTKPEQKIYRDQFLVAISRFYSSQRKAKQAGSQVKQADSKFKRAFSVYDKVCSETKKTHLKATKTNHKLKQARSKVIETFSELEQANYKFDRALENVEQARSEVERTFDYLKHIYPKTKQVSLKAEQAFPTPEKDPSKCCIVL